MSGTCDLVVFRLHDSVVDGALLGMDSQDSVVLADGYFSVQLDFGAGVYDGEARWPEVDVDCGGGALTLSSRRARRWGAG